MLELLPEVNRPAVAGLAISFVSSFLGRCPRFASANPSCGGLDMNAAPSALVTVYVEIK